MGGCGPCRRLGESQTIGAAGAAVPQCPLPLASSLFFGGRHLIAFCPQVTISLQRSCSLPGENQAPWVCACTPSKAFFFFFPFCLMAFQPAGDFADFSSWSEACQWPGFARGTEHNCPSRSGRNLVRKGTFYHTRGSHTTSYISFLNVHRPQEPPDR